MSTKKIVTIVSVVVAGVLVLCCGGGFLFVKQISGAVQPAQDAANTFIGDLEHGDYDAAHQLLCAEAREKFTVEDLRRGTQAHGTITSHKITNTNVSNYNGRVRAVVVARLSYDNGFTDTHAMPLTKQGDTWQVCGEPY
ncbi:DUF4878 domain-containing protein [Longispora sp. K20-0274]|uniref:Rv0361 family membrane protein n=1 Tax=Longispora sp. K20-0274 TaxID=3088255 RepID=UPI0039999094